MHYHTEIIIPPTANIQAAIAQVMEPFDENGMDEDGEPNLHPFWDFYVIGGRWSGIKIAAMLNQSRFSQFQAELSRRKVTISALQCGKQQLNPSDQIPMVDQLWREFFPDCPLKTCPLFAHFNNQDEDSPHFPDVMTLADTQKTMTCHRLIIAGPGHSEDGKLKANYMIQKEFWNGVTHVDSAWNGTLESAFTEWDERLKNCKPEWAAMARPKPNWLAVTVDYHS